MRAHDHEHDGPVFPRPNAARPHAPDAGAAVRAAAAGRRDAVSAGGLLALQRLAGNRGVAAALADEDHAAVPDIIGSGSGQPLDPGVRAAAVATTEVTWSQRAARAVMAGAADDLCEQEADRVTRSAAHEPAWPAREAGGSQYGPGGSGDQRLLAHELVRVARQGAPGRSGSGEGQTGDVVIQRVSRNGDYTFTGLKKDLTNVFRPVFLMSTGTDAVSDGEDVVVKFEPDEHELMDELFFSTVASKTQKVPDMRAATKLEIERCKKIVSSKRKVTQDNALVMDFVPGSKLEGLRAEGSKSYKLSDEQLHNIGRLLAFQIFMGGEDMLPVPYASNPMKPYNAGNVIVSTDPGSSKVSMIDVTPGDYKKDKPIHPEVLKGVKKLVKSQSGGPLTEAVRKMLAHSTGTSHDVGEAGREKIREGFIESMRIITEFDLEQFYASWKEKGFPDEFKNEMAFMGQMQKLFGKHLPKKVRKQ